MEFISNWLMISVVLVLLPLSQSQSDTTFFNYSYDFKKDDPNLIFQGDAHVSPRQPLAELTAVEYTLFERPLPNSAGRVVYSPPIRLWDRARRRQANFQTRFKCLLWTLRNVEMADGISFFIAPVNTTIPAGSTGGHMGIYGSSGFSPTPLFAVEIDPFSNSWDPSYRHVGININSRRSVAVERLDRFADSNLVDLEITYDATARLITVVDSGRANATVPLEFAFDLKWLLPEWVQIGLSASTADPVAAIHQIRTWSFISFLLPDNLIDAAADHHVL